MECMTRILFFAFVFTYQVNLSLGKSERHNPSSDFLLHEGGPTPNNNKDYASNFPSLPTPKPNVGSTIGTNVNSVTSTYSSNLPSLPNVNSNGGNTALNNAKPQSSGKRDYAAPQRPVGNLTPATPPPSKGISTTISGSTAGTNVNNAKPQSSGKRDYVAPQRPVGNLTPATPPASKGISTTISGSTAGTNVNNAKPQSSGKRDYVAPQRPVGNLTPATPPPSKGLSPTISGSTTGTKVNNAKQQSSWKRDYVAPQRPTFNVTPTSPPTSNKISPPNSGSASQAPKRDYVAPQFPTLRPVAASHQQPSTIRTPMPSTSPKRDYVSPKDDSAQKTAGKVKDVINFYDGKSPGGIATSRPPSYSSILSNPKDQFGNKTVNIPPSTKKPLVNTNTKLPKNTTRDVTLPSTIVKGQTTNSSSATDEELQTISEELLRKDSNNAAKYITITYQEKTTSMSKEDKAPLPLLTVAPEAWNILTVQKLLPLLDNYEWDTLVNEHITAQERNEENAFMDAVMATSVIRHLMNFLKDKGHVTPDPKQQRDFLKQLWFGLYSRGKGKISSSGFEHVFLSELKNGEVSGLHNWIYFSKEEVANRLNYLGYLKYSELSDKGAIIKLHFNQQGVDKPVGTMFFGTSPELEMALYTLCYVTRVDNNCNIKLGNKDVNIITFNYRYRSKNYIGSAFPEI